MSPNAAPVLVSARALDLRYRGVDVLRQVDLDVEAGSQVALTGRSGSGKTTLLLILAGLMKPSGGSVTWPGLTSRSIGMVFQAPSLMPELTALQNVTLPLRLAGTDVGQARDHAVRALSQMGAADLSDALPADLSGGQQQRIAIARALAGGHRLVLADEPTGALDRAHARAAVGALREAVSNTGGALILATHDAELAAMFSNRLILSDGALTRNEPVP